MTKLTKRHAFNFLRSYFDVLNEIPKNEDKLEFLLSIINKQFLDEDPTKLNFVVKLSYESQRHAVEKSVKGWKRVNNTDMQGNPPSEGGCNPPSNPKEEEEEEEEKEKEEVKPIVPTFETKKENFINWFNDTKLKYTGKQGKSKTMNSTDENNLKKLFEVYKIADFNIAAKNLYRSKWANDNNMLTISHFIRIENFNKYLEQGDKISEIQAINNQPVN